MAIDPEAATSFLLEIPVELIQRYSLVFGDLLDKDPEINQYLILENTYPQDIQYFNGCHDVTTFTLLMKQWAKANLTMYTMGLNQRFT